MNLPKPARRASNAAFLLLIFFAATSTFKAQMSAVDLSFNAVPDKDATSAPNFVVQSDNKIVVFGNFQIVNGTVKTQVARLNPDGSLDNSFNCAICDFTPTNVLLQPDGKILVSGGINNLLQAVVYRLNIDGSQDTGFISPFTPLPPPGAVSSTNSAFVNALQPDGKILVTLIGFYSGTSNYNLYRLNSDGTFDTSFTTAGVGGGRLVRTIPQKIAVLPDGKILVATNTYSGGNNAAALQRFNANGTVDSTFEAPAIVGDGGTPNGFNRSLIYDFDVQSDGSFFIVGDFSTINAVSRRNVAKLLPPGNVDTSFVNTLPSSETAKGVKVLNNGQILLLTTSRVYRLNANGSLDENFPLLLSTNTISSWSVDSTGRAVLYGSFGQGSTYITQFVRLGQDGHIENAFSPSFGIASSIIASAAQADGKVIFAGDFLRVNGVSRKFFTRVNTDGSLDTAFNTGSGFNNSSQNVTITKILAQSDGKIIVSGNFSIYNGYPREALARLNADGSLDNTFAPRFGLIPIQTVALQSDGKILIGGSANSVTNGIARLNTDGTFDTSFNPTFVNPYISSIAVQSDGKILVGGIFNGVNGFSRVNLVRLNADGTTDGSFNAGNIAGVNQVEILTDGRYLISTGTILRLNNNGATDTTFLSPSFQSPNSNSPLIQFLAQPDGSILVGGSFTAINGIPRSNFARLRPNGVLDTAFFPTGANGAVKTIVRQADGRVIVGGDFSVIGGVSRISIARLNVAAYRLISPFDFDGDGRADVAVFRPSNGNWFVLPSQTNSFYGFPFGQASDQIAPADFDGDGKTDVAVFRDNVAGAGDKAYFYILNSSDNSFRPAQFGTQGDVPMTGDWDGDGKADLAVYRAATTSGGQSYFYYRPSSQPTVDYLSIALGTLGDKPLLGDFDGDGRLDPAVFRASTATWYIIKSSVNQLQQTTFGVSTDIPVPADYDGDGAANIAVFRPSNGYWYTSQNPATNYGAIQFGASSDLPVAADFDGDGKADVAIFRPSSGAWYVNRTISGFYGVQFGASGDKPAPNAFIR